MFSVTIWFLMGIVLLFRTSTDANLFDSWYGRYIRIKSNELVYQPQIRTHLIYFAPKEIYIFCLKPATSLVDLLAQILCS